jgi:hypothetical protein
VLPLLIKNMMVIKKNESLALNKIIKQRNSWVCNDFTFSYTFMVLFQIEVVAQEKVQKKRLKFKPQVLQLLVT